MKIPPFTGSYLALCRRRRARFYSAVAVFLAMGLLTLASSGMTLSTVLSSIPFARTVAPQGQTTTLYLHGTGPVDNPSTLFLDTTSPTSTSAKYRDSAGVNLSGGNPWKEIGNWSAASSITAGDIASLSDLHVWLGLKNSDDQGTNFDLRVEAYKNGTPITSGQSLCITGVVRNAANAKEVVVPFNSFSNVSFNGSSDVLSLKILTRIGTDATGGSCGGHSNAVGLRLYFDATTRTSRFNATYGASDTTPPVLNVAQPANNSITNATEISVSGTFSDQSPTTITINGVPATVDGNSFSAIVPLSEGPNSLSIVATDTAGNRTEVARTVTRDTTAPVLSIETPADSSYTNANQIQISGTFSDAVSLTVNGTAPVINGNSFTATVALPIEGANTITVLASDAAGNQSELFHTINRDTISPTISLSHPVEGEVNKLVLTSGTVTDASPLTVTIDGTQVPTEDGFFERKAEAPEGTRQVRVVATDAAGNTNEVVLSITVDLTAPLFSNVSPAEGTAANSPATISGHVADVSAVTVKVNDTDAVVNANGDFNAANIVLAEGENQLLLTATDAAGNQNDLTLTLVGPDSTAPSAPVLYPVVSPTRLTTTTVEGRAEPGSLVSIAGGTQSVTADAAFGTGVFTANVNLAVGTNTLSVVARDAAGNSSPATQISITSDPNLALPPAGQPSQINISTGNAQKGLVNTALPRPLIAIITDRAGSPVANVTVRFTVQAGGGRLAGGNDFADVTTDAQGYASVNYTNGAAVGLQQVRADFSGNTTTPAVFLAQALEATGTETTVSGTVLDQNLRALPNVLIRIGGQQTRTGADGRFKVVNVASGPHQLLELIGRDQIPFPGRWPNISHDFDVLPGVNNELGRPLFLPKVNAGIALPLDANSVVTHDTTFELPVVGGQPPIRITAKAGTRVLFPPDVTDKTLSVTRIATNRVPMTLEDGRATNLYISVQPSGAVFETPLEVSFPNLDGLPANKQVLLMSFDHDAGRYVTVGTGHVTADGREVKSDPGNGIHVGAWGAAPPPEPEPEVTVIGHIQIAGNPAFEGKTITRIDAWVDGAVAIPMPNPTLGSIEGVDFVEVKATFPLRDPREARVESAVTAEKKLKIKFDSADSRFAPSVERFNFKYSITAPDSGPVTTAKLEVFKASNLNDPIFTDTLQTTADKLDYTQAGTAGWDGKMNQGVGNGNYIEPKDGPFTVRISAATKADLSDLLKEEKTLKVEIHSFTFSPDEFKSFKPNLTATEVDSPIELTVKVKNKAGNGVLTSLPFKIKWSFEDPDDTAGTSADTNGGAGDDNVEVRFGGKRKDIAGANPAPGKIMWKTVSGFPATISADGQTVDADVLTSGTDQGKSKLTFSTSVIAGDNYRLVAKLLKDDNVTVVKEEKSGKWSVWKRLNFGNVYRMNGGADVDTIMDRDNINPAFNGDGYTDYNLGNVTRLANGAASPRFVSPTILPPNTAETPAPNDTPAQINAKAQAWFERNKNNINVEFTNYINTNHIPPFSVIGARYYHPKYDNDTGTGGPGYWPSGTRINTADPGAPANNVDPDGEWGNVQGSEGGERAFIYLNIIGFDRLIIVGRHEVGHASDHIPFDYPTSPSSDHASSGLMHPFADQSFTNPFGVGTFSPESIRRLRGSKQ